MLVNLENFEQALSKITTDLCVVDIETEGLDIWNTHKLCGIGVCTSNKDTFYFPYRHKNSNTMPLMEFFQDEKILNLPLETMPKLFQILSRINILVGHNLKFDLAGLLGDGFNISEHQELQDTITLARLYFPDKYERLNLENVSNKVLRLDKIRGSENDVGSWKWKSKFQEYLKENKIENHFDYGSPEIVGAYCEDDCNNTFDIRDVMQAVIAANGQDGIWRQETKLLKVIWEMEQTGLFYDKQYLLESIPVLEKRASILKAEIYKTVGREFDILSNTQLRGVMASLDLISPSQTPTGFAKWGSAELITLNLPITNLILEFRSIEKMLSTYFLPLLNWKDCIVHTNFIPWGAISGRWACRTPNLQNLTRKAITINLSSNEEASAATDVENIKALLDIEDDSAILENKKQVDSNSIEISVRRLYIAPEGFEFFAIDYSQMEMRVFADYVGDQVLLEQLESGATDFHSLVAKEVWGVSEDDPDFEEYRTFAKRINFGLIYGIGNAKLAKQIGKTPDEAQAYKYQYFGRLPLALKFMQQVQQVIGQRGWVKNRFGRRYVIEKDLAYRGINYLVQGTSADIVKNRMIAVRDFLVNQQAKSKIVAQVHDELILYIHKSELHLVKPIKEIMEERQIGAYLPVDVSKGHSWATKEKVCIDCLEYKADCNCKKQK